MIQRIVRVLRRTGLIYLERLTPKEISLFFDSLAGLILLHLLKVPILSEQLALHIVVQLAKLFITLIEEIGLILLNLQRQFQYKYFVHIVLKTCIFG